MRTLFFMSVAVLVSSASLQSVSAAIIFDLRSTGSAGAALDGGAPSFEQSGLTIGVTTLSTLTGATGSQFNAVSDGAGVDSDGLNASDGDGASEIDLGETLTF